MGYYDQLIKICDSAYLLAEVLAPLGVHVGGRLIKKGDPDIGELFKKPQSYRKCGSGLLATRQANKWPVVAVFLKVN